MTNHHIPVFLAKELVTQNDNLSFRQLARDFALAMRGKDQKVLRHFKLVPQDGELIEGHDVTTERIAELRSEGRNPMWFFGEDWIDNYYGRSGIESHTAHLPHGLSRRTMVRRLSDGPGTNSI